MSDNPYPCHIHITSRPRWFRLNFKEVWQYRDLILLFTRRDLSVIYKQTLLGPMWILLNPLLSSLVYGLVFGRIAGLSTEGIPMVLFYLCGTGAWSFFAGCLTKNAASFSANAHVFGKVYFPRLTVPLSQALSALCQYLIQFLLIFCLIVYNCLAGNLSPNWHCWPLIPAVLLQLGLLGMGLGLILSSITAKYRDLNHLVNLGVQLWMYVTPVVYPLSQLESGFFKTCLLLNPVTAPVELLRYCLLGQGTVLPMWGTFSWVVTLAAVFLGVLLFNRVEKTFLDTV